MDFVDENVSRANRGRVIIGDCATCNAVTDGRAAGGVRQQNGECFIAFNDRITGNVEDDRLAGFAIGKIYSA